MPLIQSNCSVAQGLVGQTLAGCPPPLILLLPRHSSDPNASRARMHLPHPSGITATLVFLPQAPALAHPLSFLDPSSFSARAHRPHHQPIPPLPPRHSLHLAPTQMSTTPSCPAPPANEPQLDRLHLEATRTRPRRPEQRQACTAGGSRVYIFLKKIHKLVLVVC
jgi:hypothetical protein